MASNMTTKEKLTHPVTAIKEMMGKGDSHTTGTHTGTHTAGTHTGTHVPGTHTGTHVPSYTHTGTHDHNEAGVIGRYEVPATGVTHTSPTTMGNEEQLMTNQLGGTPTMGTTAGSGARPVFSEAGHQGIGHQGIGHQGIGHEGIGHEGIGHQGLGHQGLSHQGLSRQGLGHQGVGEQGVGPHQAKFGVNPASSAAAYEGQEHAGHLPGAGGVGMLGAAASKLMPGHHNKHTDTGVAHTGTTGVGPTTGRNVL